MGLHKHHGTMNGAMTPICNDCGISLCWDISEQEAEEQKEFWDEWICRDCNGGEPFTMAYWAISKRQQSVI